MPEMKARIYKLHPAKSPRRPEYLWVSILPSGTFGCFKTWIEALEYQGARVRFDR